MSKRENLVLIHIQRHPFAFGGVLFTGFVNSCVSFLLPVSIGEFFTLHFHSGSTKGKLLGWLGIHLNSIHGFYVMFIALLLVKLLAGFTESYSSSRLTELFVKDLRERTFASQMSWPASLFSKNLYGKYLLRYSNDMKSVQSYFSRGILDGIKNLSFLLTGLFLLTKIHFTLTIILGSMLLVITAIVYIISRYQRLLVSTARSHRSSLLAFVSKTFSGFEKIQLRQREKESIDKFNMRSVNLYHANLLSTRLESLIQSIAPFMIFTMIGVLLWQMTFSYVKISAGDGLMMILMMLMMQGSVKRILKVPGYINKGNISLDKIRTLLDQQPVDPEPVEVIDTKV